MTSMAKVSKLFSIKGHVLNILGFMGHMSLSQLLYSATAAQKQPQII
jgi:hypothetical protein